MSEIKKHLADLGVNIGARRGETGGPPPEHRSATFTKLGLSGMIFGGIFWVLLDILRVVHVRDVHRTQLRTERCYAPPTRLAVIQNCWQMRCTSSLPYAFRSSASPCWCRGAAAYEKHELVTLLKRNMPAEPEPTETVCGCW